jgi:hypothetical protein
MLTQITLPQIPHPPQHFIDRARARADEFHRGHEDASSTPDNAHIFNSGYTEREYIRHGVPTKTRRQHVFNIGEDFDKWVADNIHPYPYEAGISVGVPLDAPIHGPHCDPRRRYVLNYILDTGGDNVRTVWYREKGQPLERLHAAGPEGKGYWVEDYANLEVIDDVVFSPGIWILLNPKIIHSVENLQGYRTFLTISLPDMNQLPWNNRVPATSTQDTLT